MHKSVSVIFFLVLLATVATISDARRYWRHRRRCPRPFLRLARAPVCPGDRPDVPFEAALVARTFLDFNDCDISKATQRIFVRIQKNSIEWEKKSEGDCISGWKLLFTRNPLESKIIVRPSVSKSLLKTQGKTRRQFLKEKTEVQDVFDRSSNPLNTRFCISLLDLHRNIASAAKRDDLCKQSKTDNEKLSTVLGFLETLAYQLLVPLDLIDNLRPPLVIKK